jgi:hypothetical protein
VINRFREYHLELLAFVAFVVYAGILNLQFLEGSNVNYTFSGHDEYIAVREVYSILNPASFKHFALAVSAGDVMFYGRAMFYTDALLAWLPYKVWGLTGMIYAIRMAHVVYLIAAVLLLGRTFLKQPFSRLLFYLVVLTWYYTAYFVMIPKPEPLQLMVLAAFLFYAQKSGWNYGRHFILLGIAYGLKFNVLMILPVFFAAPFFSGTFKIKTAAVSVLYFISGIIIAVPSLLLTPLRPVYLVTYLKSTFGNTSHYDDTGVPFVDWLNKGLFHWYGGHSITGTLVFLMFLFMVVWLAYRLFFKKELNATLIITAMAFCFLMPVMLLTKRLWSHYLWTGSVLMVLAILVFTESAFLKKRAIQYLKYGFYVCVIIMTISSVPNIRPLFKLEDGAKEIISDSKAAQLYLAKKSEHFVCAQDISVYFPFSDFVSSYRYHPFASGYPYPMQNKVFCTTRSGFINPVELRKQEADYLLTYRSDFESEGQDVNSVHNKMVEEYHLQMRSLLNKTILKDTVIGKIRVYRIIHE